MMCAICLKTIEGETKRWNGEEVCAACQQEARLAATKRVVKRLFDNPGFAEAIAYDPILDDQLRHELTSSTVLYEPAETAPEGALDLILVGVRVKEDCPFTESGLINALKHYRGQFCDLDLFDGNEHGFIEIGSFLGSQELAFRLMALLVHFDLVQLLTPLTLLPKCPRDLMMQMAATGLVTIKAKA